MFDRRYDSLELGSIRPQGGHRSRFIDRCSNLAGIRINFALAPVNFDARARLSHYDRVAQGHGLIARVGDQSAQFSSGFAKFVRKLIELLRVTAGSVSKRLIWCSQRPKSSVVVGLHAHDVDVFKSGTPIQPQIVQVLAEETEALAKEKDRDQGEDDDRDQGVAAKETLDDSFRGKTAPARAF